MGAIFLAPSDFPGGKAGSELAVEFTVCGVPCMGLNGGDAFKQSEAFSTELLERHHRQRRRRERVRLVQGQMGAVVAKHAFEAMMKMQKIDVEAIEAAVRG